MGLTRKKMHVRIGPILKSKSLNTQSIRLTRQNSHQALTGFFAAWADTQRNRFMARASERQGDRVGLPGKPLDLRVPTLLPQS